MKNTNIIPPTASQAYVYIRLSSSSQAWGDGERRQHDAAMRFVETHALSVAETLQDIGVSAFRGDNAQTGELGAMFENDISQVGGVGANTWHQTTERIGVRASQKMLILEGYCQLK